MAEALATNGLFWSIAISSGLSSFLAIVFILSALTVRALLYQKRTCEETASKRLVSGKWQFTAFDRVRALSGKRGCCQKNCPKTGDVCDILSFTTVHFPGYSLNVHFSLFAVCKERKSTKKRETDQGASPRRPLVRLAISRICAAKGVRPIFGWLRCWNYRFFLLDVGAIAPAPPPKIESTAIFTYDLIERHSDAVRICSAHASRCFV